MGRMSDYEIELLERASDGDEEARRILVEVGRWDPQDPEDTEDTMPPAESREHQPSSATESAAGPDDPERP